MFKTVYSTCALYSYYNRSSSLCSTFWTTVHSVRLVMYNVYYIKLLLKTDTLLLLIAQSSAQSRKKQQFSPAFLAFPFVRILNTGDRQVILISSAFFLFERKTCLSVCQKMTFSCLIYLTADWFCTFFMNALSYFLLRAEQAVKIRGKQTCVSSHH